MECGMEAFSQGKVYQTRNKPGTAKLASLDDDVCVRHGIVHNILMVSYSFQYLVCERLPFQTLF